MVVYKSILTIEDGINGLRVKVIRPVLLPEMLSAERLTKLALS